MTTKYITTKTAYLYEQATGSSRSMVLIYGDEVTAITNPATGRAKVRFRGHDGYLNTSSLGTTASLEMYFIDVGTGDSAFIVTPGRKRILIDGGVNKRAMGFLAWKYQLDQPGASVDLDLLVLTHADGDHIEGLTPIIQHPKINVKRVIHSGIATFAEGQFNTILGAKTQSGGGAYLTTRHSQLNQFSNAQLSTTFAAWRNAIKAEQGATQYEAVSVDTGEINIGDPDVKLEVLGPRLDTVNGQPVYRWFNDEAHTINGHSVVLRLTYQNVQALFAGDLNEVAENYLLETPGIPAKLSAQVFKAPHHGSHDYAMEFLNAVRPQISVISSGDDPDHGHPRACFIGAVGRSSRSEQPLVFSTAIAANFQEVSIQNGTEAGGLGGSDAENRRLFKRRLHGMINVRSDGANLYAARRVAAGYWWEAYGPIPAAP
jgi:beta-lactamase superfamily II metal-dependent hydrolase